MKISAIISSAKTCNKSVKKLQKIGVADDSAYYYATRILNAINNENLKIKSPSKPVGDYISRNISKRSYVSMAKRLVKYVEENNQMPNNIKYGNFHVSFNDYTYMMARIVIWLDEKGYLPSKVNVSSKSFTAKTEDTDSVFAYFIKKFGKVKTFTEALGKIQNKGYGFYFDDKLSNVQVIDGLTKTNGEKPNCVDICHMMWHIAKGLGYDVRCLHVYCPADRITHVRLQVKHKTYTKGEWENYDPAAVANGGSINKLWCNGSGSYVIATNPNWFTQNLNR